MSLLQQLFTIDPGFDQEIQELEEFTTQLPPLKELEWSWTQEPQISNLIVAAPGIASEMLYHLEQMELVGVLPLEKSHLNLSKPGFQKGVGLYKANGFHVVLTGMRLDLESESMVSFAILKLIKNAVVVSVLDVATGMPSDEQGMVEFSQKVKNDTFKTISGFSAAIMTRSQVNNIDCTVLKVVRNANVSQSIKEALEKLRQRSGMKFALDQKVVQKLLLKPTTTSAMYL